MQVNIKLGQMPEYRLKEVVDKKDLKSFVEFPDRLFRNCPQYVPALHSDQYASLTKSASLEYCVHKMWLAYRGDDVVGRICAIINPRYNERYGTHRVRFGWFDLINDKEVAELLISAAEAWAKEQGMTEIHGPLSYNTLGRQGMLVEGFENIPPFNCLYNYRYYPSFRQVSYVGVHRYRRACKYELQTYDDTCCRIYSCCGNTEPFGNYARCG